MLAFALMMATLVLPGCNNDGEKPKLERVSEVSDLSDDRYVNMYGRTFYSEDMEGMCVLNSASGFEVRFQGTRLDAYVQVLVGNFATYDKCLFSVFIDGEKDSEKKIVVIPKSFGIYELCTIAEGLSDSEHTVKVLKRTPSNTDRCYFASLQTDGFFLSAPAAPAVKLDVYGDSITCGSGVMRDVTYDEASGKYIDSGIYTSATQNVFKSYAGVAARELDAELRVFGRGGITMKYRNPNTEEFCVLNNYKSMAVDLSVERGDCPEYDYYSYTPDAVVIYLGTNDYFRGLSYPALNYSRDGIAAGFVQFINEVVGRYYGKDMPVFLCSNMMVPQSGLAEAMEDVQEALRSQYPNIVTVKFAEGITAPSGHPVAEESEVAGQQLAAAIRAKLAKSVS